MRALLLLIAAVGASATQSTIARAQPIAGDPPAPPSCADRTHAMAVFKRMLMLAPERTHQVHLRDVTCEGSSCRIEFFVHFGGASNCRWRAPSFPPDSPVQRYHGDGDLECRVPIDDCTAIDEEGRTATDRTRNLEVYATCIQPAIDALTAAGPECVDIVDRNPLPPAPPPPPPGRTTIDLGAAWIAGDQVAPLALALGVGFDAGRAVTLGGRLGYFAAGGTATTTTVHAIDAAARLRFGREERSRFVGVEGSLGYRLTLSGDDDHAAAGAGLLLGWRGWSTVLRYERALEGSHTRDAIYLLTERGSRRTTSVVHDHHDLHGGSARRPRVGLGLALIGGGWAFATGLGPLAAGAALELPVYLGWPMLPYVRWDVLSFPGLDDDLLISQAVLVGWQWPELGKLPLGASYAVGYALAHGDRPRALEAGAVADLGLWYWLHPLGIHLGVNARLGLEDSNRDLRAVFASIAARQIFSF